MQSTTSPTFKNLKDLEKHEAPPGFKDKMADEIPMGYRIMVSTGDLVPDHQLSDVQSEQMKNADSALHNDDVSTVVSDYRCEREDARVKKQKCLSTPSDEWSGIQESSSIKTEKEYAEPVRITAMCGRVADGIVWDGMHQCDCLICTGHFDYVEECADLSKD